MREDLHRLVRDLRLYVEWQRRGLVHGASQLAPAEAREAFEARSASRQAKKAEAQAAVLRGPAPVRTPEVPVVRPAQPRVAPNPAPAPGPATPRAPRADDTPVRRAPPAPAKGGDKLWLEFGAQAKSTFGESHGFKSYDRAFDPDDTTLSSREKLQKLRAFIGDCQRCDLCQTRTNLVFGVGNPDAKLMFVGEAPGFNEDKQGEPFVGKAGDLLNKMIGAMGYRREDVYIANVIKCRPPDNRDPSPEEIRSCGPFMLQQVEAIRPQVIVTLGKFGTNALLGREGSLTQVRGQWQDFNGVPVMPTFHPAFLLRNPDSKREAWADLQAVMVRLKG